MIALSDDPARLDVARVHAGIGFHLPLRLDRYRKRLAPWMATLLRETP